MLRVSGAAISLSQRLQELGHSHNATELRSISQGMTTIEARFRRPAGRFAAPSLGISPKGRLRPAASRPAA